MIYRGHRFGGRCVVTRDGKKIPLRLDLMNHSPTGFEWGYGGSGPAQTALAILADYLKDDDRAVLLHQKFKWDVISKMPHDRWSIDETLMRGWLKLHQDIKDVRVAEKEYLAPVHDSLDDLRISRRGRALLEWNAKKRHRKKS